MQNIYFLVLVGILFIASSCTEDTIEPIDKYQNELSFIDTSDSHPKNDDYQAVIDKYIPKGIIGCSVMIQDSAGVWLGAGGMSDLASNIPVGVSHQFMIGSISKMFTATVIFSLVDKGLLSIEDPVNKWIEKEVADKIDNANEAKIQHLLGHTSGIADYYTPAFEAARYNRENNNWTQEDILSYVYGKNASFTVGQRYGYSNTNYVLLGMIIEKASGKSLKENYHEYIFNPLNLTTAYYDIQQKATPSTLIKGYVNPYGVGYIEASSLYGDETSTADGAIIVNAQGLGRFIDALMNGELVSTSSLAKMQDWFDIEEGDEKNGYGIEYIVNDYGIAYGHTGAVDGFSSIARYYPSRNITTVFLFNFSPTNESASIGLAKELTGVIFEE